MTDHTPSDPAAPRPFTFDRIFSRVDDAATKEADSLRVEAIQSDAAFEDGRKWGQEEVRASTETRLATALERLSRQFNGWINAVSDQLEAHQHQAKAIVCAIATNLYPDHKSVLQQSEFEGLVDACFDELHARPWLVVRVSPEMAADVKSCLDRLLETQGFTGKLVVKEDPALSGDLVFIEAEDGTRDRRSGQIYLQTGELVSRYLSQGRSGEAPPSTAGTCDDNTE